MPLRVKKAIFLSIASSRGLNPNLPSLNAVHAKTAVKNLPYRLFRTRAERTQSDHQRNKRTSPLELGPISPLIQVAIRSAASD